MRILLILLFLSPVHSTAKPTIVQSCSKCHGPGGASNNPTIPNLNGQNKGYLMSTLKGFKAGKRIHQLMTPISQTLSDTEIEKISAYYSKQK